MKSSATLPWLQGLTLGGPASVSVPKDGALTMVKVRVGTTAGSGFSPHRTIVTGVSSTVKAEASYAVGFWWAVTVIVTVLSVLTRPVVGSVTE